MRDFTDQENELALQFARALESRRATNALQDFGRYYQSAVDEAKLRYDTAVERATRDFAEQVADTMSALERRLALLQPDDADDDDDDDELRLVP